MSELTQERMNQFLSKFFVQVQVIVLCVGVRIIFRTTCLGDPDGATKGTQQRNTQWKNRTLDQFVADFKTAADENRTQRSGFYRYCESFGNHNFATTGPISKIFQHHIVMARRDLQTSVKWADISKNEQVDFFIWNTFVTWT